MRRFFAHSISVARSPAGRNVYGAGRVFAIWRSASAFDGRIFPTEPGTKCRSCRSAAEWNVEARTPGAPSADRRCLSSPAALSVNVTAMICAGAKAPLTTCWAIRRVIVVVLPEPAPARMQTGPRTASAARRCSGFRPSSGSIRPRYRWPRKDNVNEVRNSRTWLKGEPGSHTAELVQCVFENRFAPCAHRFQHHRLQLRDDADGVAFFDQALEVGECVLEPDCVDLRPRGAHDLRMRGRAYRLALVPEHLVHLLAGARAGEDDRNVVLVAAGEPDHLLCQLVDLHGLTHVEHVDLPAPAHCARLDDE